MKKIWTTILILVLSTIVIKSQTTITDIDGNSYTTVTLGTQTWMAQNLKTTKYNDGTSIEKVENSYTWTELSTGAYCWYDNNITNKNIYGALYNWYAVESGNLCPIGWHVPTDAEWTVLENYLIVHDSTNYIGQHLKSTTLWYQSNNGTDRHGFGVYPAGWRNGYINNIGYFYGLGKYGIFWTATVYQTVQAQTRLFYFASGAVSHRHFSKTDGFSVRCLQD